MKGKTTILLLVIIVLVLLGLRLCVFDVVSVPTTSRCPKTGHMVLVDRWAYGYRLPWKCTSRWSYTRAKTGDWVAYNRPASSPAEKTDTTALYIGKVAAAAGDTIWYNNDSGRISTTLDTKNGFTHPLIVPIKGRRMPINEGNVQFYAITIMQHEPTKASVVDGRLCVDGKIVREYCFQQDYYWILTTNPKDKSDSNTFGFVPHVSLIGKIN